MRGIFKKAALASWVYLGVTTGFGILSLIAATAWLQAEQAGLWFTLQATGNFVALCEWGTTYVIMREMATNSAIPPKELEIRPPSESTQKLSHSDHTKIKRITSINLSTAIFATAGFFAYFTQTPTVDSRTLLLSWVIYAISVGFNIASGPLRAILESQGRLHVERLVSAASHALASSMIIGVAYAYQSILPMAAALAAGSALTFVALYSYVRIRTGEAKHSKDLLTSGLKSIYRESFGFSWINIGATSTKSAYAPIVTGILGAAALAPIYLANKILATASTAINILITSERSTITKLMAAREYTALNKLVNHSLRINGVLSISSATIVGVVLHFGPEVLGAPQYSIPIEVLIIMVIDLVLNNITSACAHIVNALGENPFKASVPISGVITLAALVILIPKFGILGAVLAPFLGGLLTSYWYNPFRLLISKKQLMSGV